MAREVSRGPPVYAPCCPARYITQQGNKLETGKSRVPPTVTNAVSWRSEGIKYKKNEVFIDVIESVNLLVSPHTFTLSVPPSGGRREDPLPANPLSPCLHPQVNANGSVLLSEIVGTIKLKVFLSGMPELRLGLNDRVLFELTGRKCVQEGSCGNGDPFASGPQSVSETSSEISTCAPSAGHNQHYSCWFIEQMLY